MTIISSKALNSAIRALSRLAAVLVPLTLLSLLSVGLSACQSAPHRVLAHQLRLQLALGPRTFVVANTGSMEPYIHGGDRITVYLTSFKDIKKGDRVDYAPAWLNGVQVPHVAVRWNGFGWITKGINNEREDPYVMTAANYIGYWEKTP